MKLFVIVIGAIICSSSLNVHSSQIVSAQQIIKIVGDSNFTKENGVIGGNGSEVNPYLIENISCAGIWIENTTKYFVIKNVSIRNGYKGIILQNVSNGYFENITIYNFANGIYIRFSKNISIENSIIEGCEKNSIYVYSSYNFTITNSTINNSTSGITVYKSAYGKILYNDINNCSTAISFLEGKRSIIAHNNISFCTEGIYMSFVEEEHEGMETPDLGVDMNTIERNFIMKCDRGIVLVESSKNVIQENVFDHCIIGLDLIRVDENNISKNNFFSSEIVISSSTNVSLIANNFIRSGVRIVGSGLEYWITHIFRENRVNGKNLIYIKNKENEKIEGEVGEIIAVNVKNLTIENLHISNVSVGIYIAFSQNCLIRNTTITNITHKALYILNGKNIFVNNLYVNNVESGIYIQDSKNSSIEKSGIAHCSKYGMFLHNTKKIYIVNNTFSFSSYALYLSESSRSTITSNSFYKNNYGIYLDEGCTKNTIYGNNFINNDIQARDDGYGNKWSTSYGNYWSDYYGEDFDGDGILNGIYKIDGKAQGIDYLPLSQFPPKIRKNTCEYYTLLEVTLLIQFLLVCMIIYIRKTL